MNFFKPKFWDKNQISLFSILLFPVTIIIKFLFFLKTYLTKTHRSSIPIICIGNIYLGGTGKTPLCIEIFSILKNLKMKPAFIRKQYDLFQDEINLQKSIGPVYQNKKRVEAVQEAVKNNINVAILDDGFQDFSVEKNFSIVCFTEREWIGNGLIIPSGPLRENIKSLRKYNNIFLNGNDEKIDNIINEIKNISEDINIFEAKYEPTNLEKFDESEKYLAFSGIGNHQTFVNMLKNNKLKVIKDIEFPDHYNYRVEDIDQIISKSKALGTKIITTEKDFVKLDKSKKDQINYIKIDLVVQDLNRIIKKLI